jgi:hypothetical protein
VLFVTPVKRFTIPACRCLELCAQPARSGPVNSFLVGRNLDVVGDNGACISPDAVPVQLPANRIATVFGFGVAWIFAFGFAIAGLGSSTIGAGNR